MHLIWGKPASKDQCSNRGNQCSILCQKDLINSFSHPENWSTETTLEVMSIRMFLRVQKICTIHYIPNDELSVVSCFQVVSVKWCFPCFPSAYQSIHSPVTSTCPKYLPHVPFVLMHFVLIILIHNKPSLYLALNLYYCRLIFFASMSLLSFVLSKELWFLTNTDRSAAHTAPSSSSQCFVLCIY